MAIAEIQLDGAEINIDTPVERTSPAAGVAVRTIVHTPTFCEDRHAAQPGTVC